VPSSLSLFIFVVLQSMPTNVVTPPRAGTEKPPPLFDDFDRFSGMLRECVPCHLLVL